MKTCRYENLEYANYLFYYWVFTEEFNISFLHPRKINAKLVQVMKMQKMKKQPLKDAYDNHHYEKELSKKEKNNDKQNKEAAV